MFIQENAIENVVWKMSAILSRPQYVNWKMSAILSRPQYVNYKWLVPNDLNKNLVQAIQRLQFHWERVPVAAG